MELQLYGFMKDENVIISDVQNFEGQTICTLFYLVDNSHQEKTSR
jgi:hypothetical protein